MVKSALEQEHHSFTRKYGGSIELDCDTATVRAIFRKYPRASRQWVHNNNALVIESDRMFYQMGVLTIQNLNAEDQGVFICRIEYEPKQFKSVALFSLVIETNEKAVSVQETQTLALQSNSAPIGYLFPSATRTWRRNGAFVRSNISASKSHSDQFHESKKDSGGIWTCTVSRKLHGASKEWKTARYQVKVMPPPTELEQAVSYSSNHPIIVIMVFLGISGFLLVVFIFCIYRADQDQMAAKVEMDKMKESLLNKEENDEYDNDIYTATEQDHYGQDQYPHTNDEQYYHQIEQDYYQSGQDHYQAEQDYYHNEQNYYPTNNDLYNQGPS